MLNGEDGISRKGPLPGEASHYISFTRLKAEGTLAWKGRTFALAGSAWMDHEFFTEPEDNTLVGWDWFAIQFANDEELMLYRLRRTSGAPDPYSSGTFVDAQGMAHFLAARDFSLSPGETWRSPSSGARYPIAWSISVPSLSLNLTEQTPLKNQELYSPNDVSPGYWEGAVTYNGQMHSRPIQGVGYLEMTGYAERVRLSGVSSSHR